MRVSGASNINRRYLKIPLQNAAGMIESGSVMVGRDEYDAGKECSCIDLLRDPLVKLLMESGGVPDHEMMALTETRPRNVARALGRTDCSA
jgi:hypothetical protein